jgi:hypothetical protein
MHLGGTGKFPEGKLDDTDEGELAFAIGVKNGNVIINFGTPIAWIALEPQMAAKLGAALIKRARMAAREMGKTVTVKIS